MEKTLKEKDSDYRTLEQNRLAIHNENENLRNTIDFKLKENVDLQKDINVLVCENQKLNQLYNDTLNNHNSLNDEF